MPLANTRAGRERTERLEARITRGQKSLFRRAAKLQGRTLSDFIVQAASEAAKRVVQEHQVITLTAQEQAVFVEALLSAYLQIISLRGTASLLDNPSVVNPADGGQLWHAFKLGRFLTGSGVWSNP
jgi:uncharacterized protein (DUF1778 family)